MDEPQFRQLYVEHADAVFTFVSRRLAHGDAEDLVADVFVIAWRRREQLPADPRGWLLGVARRLLANARRREARAVSLTERLGHERDPESRDHDEAPRALIWSALATLDADDRDLLELLAWDGLTRSQLASVFGVNRGAIAVRIHRARRRLIAAMDASLAARSAAPTRTTELKESGHA